MRANFATRGWTTVLAATLVVVNAPSALGEYPLPWTLRDHYSIPAENGYLDYAEANAEWRVRIEESRVIAKKMGFAVTLDDGTTLNAADLGKAKVTRERFDAPMGDGNHYIGRFPAKDGLEVWHRLSSFNGRPFVLMEMGVRNAGTTPVAIRSLAPVVAGPDSLPDMGPDADVLSRRLDIRGGYPGYDARHDPLWMMFHDKARETSLALGVLPSGNTESGVDFTLHGGAWHGGVTCAYEPAVQLAPGESLASDTVWISYGVREPQRINLYYAWAFSTLPDRPAHHSGVHAWVTVDEDHNSLSNLARAVVAWVGTGVDKVLVPSGWSRRPGVSQGAAPNYPKNPRDILDPFNADYDVGITIDPLAAENGDGAWSAKSADGQVWLDLNHPAARNEAEKRVRALAGDGFKFFVVEKSLIPDAVLAHFGQTRAEADRLALEVTMAAAGDRPVYPDASTTMGGARDAWLAATAGAGRMAEYAVAAAPLRIEADALSGLDDETMAAMRMWPGPIELVGAGNATLRGQMQQVLQLGRVVAIPVDAEHTTPLLWQLKAPPTFSDVGASVVAFSGADTWSVDALELAEHAQIRVWHASSGKLLETPANTVPGSSRFEVYGVTPIDGRPVFMGSSNPLSLSLDRIQALDWHPGNGRLSGRFETASAARAYVYVPSGWTLKSGTADGRKVRGGDAPGPLAFNVGSGTAAFDLEFQRQ